jgi:type VI secretion system protein VasD
MHLFGFKRVVAPVSLAAVLLMLVACKSTGDSQSKPAIQLELTIVAADSVNPDVQRRAAPIVMRLYELKNTVAFEAADYFTLYDSEKATLGGDLLKRDEYILRPGEKQHIARKADLATTALGVVASYRDLPGSVWRAVYAMPAITIPESAWYRVSTPSTPALKLVVTLDTNAVNIIEQKK